ncbi:MAG TPA: putative Ig domain-containing protein [Verrucomicrobiae bacterium]|jgi:hypothetical protein
MKTQTSSATSLLKINRWLLVFGLLAAQNILAATFSLTPATVSNTYNGTISLSVGGLTNGETVVVQKFLDLNTNGVIDASDYLVQQFTLQDGANFVIGGVTNFNVPGDLNSTTGNITATLNFQGGDFVQNLIGNYLYKLSSPSGNFAPVTNLFSVTNFPFAQKITGTVVNSGTNVPNAVIILFPPPRSGSHDGPGTPVGGAVANNSGSYTIQLPAGTYTPLAFRSNFVANYSTSPQLILSSSATINTDLVLTNATQSITGRYVDATSNTGLPGIFVALSSDSGSIAACFTDTNGNFTGRVPSGQWNLGSDDSGLIIHGYVGSNNGTNVNAGTTGVTLAYPKATALFYGRVVDSSGNPLTNIDIGATDNNGLYSVDGYSDTNGNYYVAVLGGLGSDDPWQLQTAGSNPTTYIFSQPAFNQNGGTNLPVGQASRQNFTVLLATSHITGNVQYQGANVSGVAVSAYANISGVDFFVNADTDDNGNYSLDVANGNWSVSVSCQGGDASLDNTLGNGNYQCPNNTNVVIAGNDGTANFVIQPCGGIQIITPSPLNGGQSGSYYSVQFEAESCNGNFNWSVNDPADLPPGLMLYSSGALNGTPTAGGTYNFSVHVSDGSGASANQSFSLNLAACTVQINTASLTNGQVNSFYDFFFQGAGSCDTNLTWAVNDPSDLPPGMSLHANGELQGNPGVGGTYNFSVHLHDGSGNSTNKSFSIFIVAGALQVNTSSTFTVTNTLFFSQTIQALGGVPPYSWSIPDYSADPPANLALSAGGVLSGTPATTVGSYAFDVEVTDNANNTAAETLTVYVVNPPLPALVITNTALPAGTIGVAYSAQLGATGGQTPYNWTLALGSASLPAGLSLNNFNGLISGTPTTNKTSTFKVQVADGNSSVTNKVLSITINPQPSLGATAKISGTQFQFQLNGASNQNYTLQMSTNLANTSWTSLFTTNNATNGSLLITDPHATNQQRFYRVLIGP